ncbi:methyl-accepting chemotaxis protein [Catenovulum sediminis]|uniref:Methyl-accepting chemotaxis protein n=1 Tax=Catenovulum sediminis TaxID=1740262 RepID=A0ABV1RGP2_9ALTE|nr:methyl-accepting chemotaxis protein [Catenovulum sediminis]
MSNMHFPWTNEVHKVFKPFLIGLFCLSLFYALFYGTWLEVMIIGIPALVMPWLFIQLSPHSASSRYAVAIGTMIFSALHIHQMQGLIEIHFGIFAYLAALVFYRDWKVIALAVVVVLLYHLGFFWMQLQAMPVYLFEEGHLKFNYLLFHAFYAVLEGAIMIFICTRMLRMGLIGDELKKDIEKRLEQPGRVKLSGSVNTFNNIKILNQYNKLFNAIRQLTDEFQKTSDLLHNESGDLKSSFSHLSAMQKQGQQHTDSIASATSQMSKTVNEIAHRAVEANDQVHATLDAVANAEQKVDKSKSTINEFERVVRKTSQEITALSESCSEISGVLESIQAIAEQTNLLALNAAIESARAGEHGRGFAVVADEVRQLSFRTKESTAKIAGIMEILLNKSRSSVEAMNSSLDKLDFILVSSDELAVEIKAAAGSVSQVAHNIDMVATATEEQATAAESVAHSANEVKTIADKETSELTNISTVAEHVSNLAEKLKKALAKFD